MRQFLFHCLFASFVLIFFLQSLAFTKETSEKKDLNPETSSLIYAYGGYGYYRWKMMSMNDYFSLFGSSSSMGLDYTHNASPFIVKKYGVKTNISILSLGMDYLSDKLSLPTEYNSSEDLQAEEDDRAQELKLLSGLQFGNIALQGDVVLREFKSTITSKGYKDYDGSTTDIYYYPKSGDMITLSPGDKISWYTRYSQYTIKLAFIGDYLTTELGGKYVQYEAPTELTVTTMGSSGEVFMYTNNRYVDIFIGLKSRFPIWGDLYMTTYTPLSLSGLGGYSAQSDYFKSKEIKPFSFDNFNVSSSGSITLQYILKHMKIEGGVDYGMYYSWLTMSQVKLKKEITYFDTVADSTATVNRGDRVDMEFKRLEFFWGFFLSASVFF